MCVCARRWCECVCECVCVCVQTHPNINRGLWTEETVLAHRDQVGGWGGDLGGLKAGVVAVRGNRPGGWGQTHAESDPGEREGGRGRGGGGGGSGRVGWG